MPGQTSVIKVTVTGKENQTIAGAKVMLSSTPGGKVSPEYGTTDLNGQFTSTFNGSVEEKVTVSALVTKEGFAAEKSDIQIEIGSHIAYPSPAYLPWFGFFIMLFLILLALLVAVTYRTTKKKETMANSLEIPTKMYEGDSDIIVLRLAEWGVFTSNGKAKTLFFIDAYSKRQPLGMEIPSVFFPKFLEVELLAPGFDVEGEKRQKNEIFMEPMTYQWGICPSRPGNYEIGLVFRFEETSGRVGELGVITHKMNVVKIFGLNGRQIGGLVSVSQIVTWILAIILALNTLGFKLT
jgi:hypothetical protein